MADDKKGVPPITPKSKTREQVERGMRATSTGGDTYDRMQNRYSKNAPPREDSFEPDY